MNIELDKAVHKVDLTEPMELIKQLEAKGYAVVPKGKTCRGCIYLYKDDSNFCKHESADATNPACILFTPIPPNSRELKAEVK